MYQSHAIGSSPERSPSKHVQRGHQPVKSTAGQNQQELAAGESSDSGDSLFITQKETPAPVRSARRSWKRSGLTSSRCLEESEVESSSSLGQKASRTQKKTARKKITLPVYTFSFLADNEYDGALPFQKNRILSNLSITSFFKCLREIDTAKTYAPTVDGDKEDLSPLSEEEEEQSHTEGFRVVDKMCFVTSLKATSCRPWCSQRKRQKRMNTGCVAEETLRENGLTMQENIPAEASTSTNVPVPEHRKHSDNAAHFSKVLNDNEQEGSTALKTNRCLTLGTKEASGDNNSNTSVCEPPDVGGGGEVCNLTQRMDTSEDSVPQSDFSVAVQKKKKRRTSSFLCADAVEKDVQTARKHFSVQAEVLDTQSAEITENLEPPDRRVKEKKRKRKHDYEDDAEAGVERKKDSDRHRNGLGTATEMMEGAAVLDPLKKKRKEDSGCMSEEGSTYVGTCDRFFEQASYSQTPGKLALKKESSKMEPNSSDDPLQEELLTTSKHSKFRKKKKKRTAAPQTAADFEQSCSKSEMSSPDCVVSKKHRKLKRKLYHPVEDWFE